ncbi:MAG: site-specific integrase [Acidobacteria bacterium]|nr:site-specific integrase [Acidobacteriota bacterium]
MSRDEEERLLLACVGPRAHLRPILICALDTAMRRGEIFQLRWKDVDLAAGEIMVRATTTKTGKSRTVPITSRLREELTRLKASAPPDPDGRVFGIADTIKKSFQKACKAAGVEGFRLHDARHAAITRFIEQGVPPMQVMAISGHTQMQTFARYVNADKTALRRAASAMDDWHQIDCFSPASNLIN